MQMTLVWMLWLPELTSRWACLETHFILIENLEGSHVPSYNFFLFMYSSLMKSLPDVSF